MTKQRRKSHAVRVGNATIGGEAPILIQSMTTTPTLDVEASAKQTLSIAHAGAGLVRLTAQGVSHAAKLEDIHRAVREAGCDVAISADIHFNPAAAFEAAKHVEKVRINPGNFFDPGRTFRKMVFTDEEYAAELEKIREKFVPFLDLCRANGTAIRIGVNHGSLSDRIMSRYGDGAEGMVESAMEYLRICEAEGFDQVVISIKASDVPLMTSTMRLMVQKMAEAGMTFPLHLGVTEAGNALEGRIKSSVGIGSLLLDGIGDTIRVSLSEAPENEIPVARMLVAHCEKVRNDENNPANKLRREFAEGKLGETAVLSYPQINDKDELIIAASADFGALLLDGFKGKIQLESPLLSEQEAEHICQDIIQAAGIERFHAEIVACPGCGRTLFDLPEALERVKKACHHLKHLKVAVMGCIVNGPGEMAGADYGYVGAAAGNVSIYRGTECVIKNIPQDEALEALVDLIKKDGQWVEKEIED